MKSLRFGLLALGLTLVAAGSLQAQWYDTFDSYAKGRLDPQSNWEQWRSGNGTDAMVVDTYALSLPHSVEVAIGGIGGGLGDDVVYDFKHLSGGQPTSGQWICTSQTYVPTTSVGTGYYIMLNRYPDQLSWSLQLRIEPGLGRIQLDSDAGSGPGDLPLIFDQWVPIYSCIDLESDRVDIYYGKDLLAIGASWINGLGSGGSKQIAALDLYSGEPDQNGITELFFDNTQMDKVQGPCLVVNASPNPALSGNTLTLSVGGPMLANQTAALFVWEVLGNPLVLRLLVAPLNGNGEFEANVSVPPGLAGIDIGLKAFSSVAGGGLAASNIEHLYFQ